ncbi:MAG: Integrase core domain protein [Actinobacteria bacterium ADurb.Bin444]|nr:MAG: Integrase core domain protein [Actinobacteria bacterium ADurb.Bin444]
MGEYPRSEVDRAMKVQEVMMRAMSGQLQWDEAAEIIGVSCRTMRRWKRRYQEHGYDGLFDRRRQRPSPKRVAVETVQKVLRLYHQEYNGFNVAHFHDKLTQEHGILLSYEWVKKALQTAGLVSPGRRRGRHRQRRERRPMRGMLVFCDGSSHAWIPCLSGQTQDLIVYLDDATNEVYCAYLVEEEGTMTCMQGLLEVIEDQGLFCSLYTDRGSHFFHTSKAGGAVDKSQLTQMGRALAQLGIEHIPSYSPEARGRMERLFGTWQGRLPQELRKAGIRTLDEANAYIKEKFLPWYNRTLTVQPREQGSAFVPAGDTDLQAILCVQHERVVQKDNTVTVGSRTFQIAPSQWRVSFAKCRVKLCEHLNGTLSVRYGPRILGRYHPDGSPIRNQKHNVA